MPVLVDSDGAVLLLPALGSPWCGLHVGRCNHTQ